jgi:MoaA/NifB/PqqE/SkfB family radical SAM enzyme
MRRKKQVMSVKLFEKVVHDYASMGGGAIKLTPCAGEILTDPYLPDRFEILSRYKEIGNISFTTNLITHKRLSDLQWMEILRNTYFFQVSIGGLDRDTYTKMFGVDKVETVIEGIERIISLKKKSGAETNISLTFRTDRSDYLEAAQNELRRFKQNGIYISNIASYGNWGGILNKQNIKNPLKIKEEGPKNTSVPCVVMVSVLGVLSSGTVTACACCDMDGTFFPLGNIAEANLSELYTGTTRRDLLKKMLNSQLGACLNCSMYWRWDHVIGQGWINLENPENIPLRYYQEFSGG